MDKIGSVLPLVIKDLQEPEKLKRIELLEKWQTIIGKKFYSHTKPTLSQRGDLCVWVDQSVLGFELNQKYKLQILKRAQAALGEKAVTTVRIRVGELR